MNVPEKLTYQEVCKWLTGESDLALLNKLEKNIVVYGIYRFMKENYSTLSQYSDQKELTFDEAEKYLEKYLAGNFNKQDAYKLTNALLYSERNFQKFNSLIEQHSEAVSSYNNANEYDQAFSGKDIIAELQKIKNKKPHIRFHIHRNKIVPGMLAAAATLLFLLMIPFQINNKLDELYSFDKQVPLDYNQSAMRGTEQGKENTDSAYNHFKFKFNKGMSEYLAQEYANALHEWQALQSEWSQIEKNPFFTAKDEHDFWLYNAVCRIALYLSAENKSNTDKELLLAQSIESFEKLALQNDFEQYYYALALALDDNKEKALNTLNSINQSSVYYYKKQILEEQLNQ